MNVFHEEPSALTLSTPKGSTTGTTVAILLEELRLPYHLHFASHSETPRPHPDRITLTDIDRNGHSTVLEDFDAITSYLLTRYDENHRFSYPAGSPESTAVRDSIHTLLSRMGGNHSEGGKEAVPSVRKILSLYLHLEEYLQKTRKRFLVGDKCTLADLAHFPYVAAASIHGLDLERFPELTSWYDRLARQGAVRKGMEAVGFQVDDT
ncbi:putative glutathione-S-transferase theta, GST [Aspergillus sclerotiicarbonarius CBS 121057]|uniref:Putative glutathione-S-transferase theta, GST n=1 Tax=Aspergillus sclerotiicarbonarius (strain CBS 121057 / IBT 28362) TaxID=1448318 RepID=A0A319E0M4_ASPSB|nr:putative glutathione-S-transferase theta, GST [Aspergillus sclerotiicarbonarius CBS 121057]